MDYKAKYEAAMNQAKLLMDNNPDDRAIQFNMVTMFPELVELHNDSIRVALLKAFRGMDAFASFWTATLKISKHDVLSWLEKQKPEKWTTYDQDMYDCIVGGLKSELSRENSYIDEDTMRMIKEWLKLKLKI